MRQWSGGMRCLVLKGVSLVCGDGCSAELVRTSEDVSDGSKPTWIESMPLPASVSASV